MASEPEYLTGKPAAIKAFLDKFDTFLFDCDGVLWSGDTIFPKTVETLSMLRKAGKRVVFVTNNSTKSRADYNKKLLGLGIPASPNEVFSSSYSAAIYISRILSLPPTKRTVFVLGESGIEAELRAESVPFIGGTDPAYRRAITPADYAAIAAGQPPSSEGPPKPGEGSSSTAGLDPSVGVVLCGLDFHPSYLKFALAYHYIAHRGATFLATNTDATLPSAGALFPGAGAMTAPLTTALGGQQPLSLGKPGRAMMDAVEGKFRFERRRACMVGDRMETDVRFGVEGGLGGTLAVLTGVSGREEVVGGVDGVRPAAYVNALGDLYAAEDEASG